ncbi:Pyruvate/2-oxoglutarate dehydrogenase complex, dihydrolipoamide dehydrogenase (E3) component [Catalinimonas alkaloidigena]|uniref:Pyruvate/2-oxoglutarate dehydrogenase complex, dihydrolipoamide dehydrogenase (E3) component n=1 Tax=Catalinimonas alkaloidigena TaxID=1075417 RepID=A0A1G8Y0C8_9BACT|nr:FAD-dependent oxidoreductase [Catalinimonas alkaloidigena]SDJ96243.1 Pyruvate/2-oxoglutarate dehydrogenase complex, dihydrolipoamide dehydrogenase (E3) component [Catalinimonas alkaloidigena]
MTTAYDLIVVGGGAAGLYLAISMQKFGFRVLLIEREASRIGGDCLNTGCVPSKSLLHIAHAVHAAKTASQFGLHVNGTLDYQKVAAYLDRTRHTIRQHENVDWLRAQGIAVVLGEASFVSRNAMEVNGTAYSAKRFVLATGSRAKPLQVPGIEHVKVYTNETLFSLQELPQRLLVVGGGAVAVEMSQAFRRLGATVTVVNQGKRLLEKDPPETAEVMQQRLEAEGIRCCHQSQVVAFPDPHTAVVKGPTGETEAISCEAVLVAIGRELNLEPLQLARGGIATEHGKIRLNAYLQTTNPRVFVSGDAAGQLQFTHAAELHGKLLLNNFFSPLKKKISYDNFSWVTYTDPQVATFGLPEAELQKRGVAYEKLVYDFAEFDRAVIEDYPWGKLVLFTSKSRYLFDNTTLLGGSIVAPVAGEMIQELITAKEAGLGTNTLFNKVYPYPSHSNATQQALTQRFLKGITPLIQKVMKGLY